MITQEKKEKVVRNKVERFIKDAWSQGQELTVAKIAEHCFPNKSLLEARGAVHSYLHGLRKRKNPMIVFPVLRGGNIVDMTAEDTDAKEIRLITERHVSDIQTRWNNTKSRIENPLVAVKVGLQLLQEFSMLGIAILNDLQEINHLASGEEHKRLEGGQESTKNLL